jgi:hypothetical protein
VEIKRSPHTLDHPSVIDPDGLVFISNALFVEGRGRTSRPLFTRIFL